MTRPFALVSAIAILGAVGAAPRPARAGGPTMSECLAANEAAIKLRDAHKLRDARAQSLTCSAPSCPAMVRDACQGRVQALSAAIPTIVLQAKDANGNDLTDVRVTMDGQPFAPRLDGSAIAIDPGEHTFAFVVDGQPKLEKHIVVYQGETNRHERVQIGEAAAVAAVASPSAPTPAATSSGLGTARIAAIVLAGVGAVGIGVGAGMGAAASSAWSSVKSACGPGGAGSCAAPVASRASLRSDETTASTDGTISTIGFIAGGALIVAGTVVFLTAGKHAPEKSVALVPSVGPGQAGFVLRGGF